MTTRLEDLPAFEVAHVESGNHPRLHGVFNHLRSVKAGRSWLYHPVCLERIGRWGDEYGYVAGGPAYIDRHDWLCDRCGEKFAVPRSLAFAWDGAWEPR